MGEELLSWLLPEASAAELGDLRRVIIALRLMRDDARRHEARASPPWSVAQSVLEGVRRQRHRRLLEGLLRAYLVAHGSADSFLELAPGAVDHAPAWRELLEGPGPVGPPGPEESPRRVVERLIAAGPGVGAPSSWVEYWRACASHVFDGAAAAERLWRRAFEAALEGGAPPPLMARFLSGLVAARLDRFQPEAAWRLYVKHTPLAGVDGLLRRLFGWTALFVGEDVRARELLRSAPTAALPRPVAEFRALHPEWAACLEGAARCEAARAQVAARAGPRALGARMLAVFAVQAGAARLIALECERAQEAAVLGRARDLRRLPAESHSWRARAGGPAWECLGGPNTAAVARAFVREEGELRGWIQLESSHRLLPSAPQLSELAGGWHDALLAAGRSRGASSTPALVHAARPDEALPDPRCRFAASFLAALGPLPGVRVTWLERDESGRFVRLAWRGGARAGHRMTGGDPVARAVLAGDPARAAGEPGVVRSPGAAASVALPLRARSTGRRLALLVVECARGDPFDERRIEELRARLASCERAWWAVAFAAWHRRRTGMELVPALAAPWMRRAEEVFHAALGARAPVLVSGPDGSGRRTLASALDFRAGDGGRVAGRILVLDPRDLARQAELARRREASVRLWLVAQAPAPVLRARGELAPELERALHPDGIQVPPLGDRRGEIPDLVRALSASAVRHEGRAPPSWCDRALAVLFRQAWPGNTAELRAVVEELIQRRPGGPGAEDVAEVLKAHGLPCCERLDPARQADLEAAVDVTRHRNGNPNLARAARYLGWSAESLVARLGRDRDGGEQRADP